MSRLDVITDWRARAEKFRYNAACLAAQLKVSPRHLRLYCSRVFGRSPRCLLDSLRLAEAARLLCEEGETVGETARLLRFANVQHFCKQFKRFLDCTPSEFALRHARQKNEWLDELESGSGFEQAAKLLPPPPWKQIERALLSRLAPRFTSPSAKPMQ